MFAPKQRVWSGPGAVRAAFPARRFEARPPARVKSLNFIRYPLAFDGDGASDGINSIRHSIRHPLAESLRIDVLLRHFEGGADRVAAVAGERVRHLLNEQLLIRLRVESLEPHSG